jgi:hypothetical protein
MPGATLLLLTGCVTTPTLPECTTGVKKKAGQDTAASPKTAPPAGAGKPAVIKKASQQVFIGIDGSGSMLGYAQASNRSVWPRLLQSISQAILLKGLQPITYRIGAGAAEGPLRGSVTQATNPCFFKGCDGYRPVESSLDTLWTIQRERDVPRLRLLVSDLEVNQDDVTSLLAGIQPDLAMGASAGILGIKAPFTGNVFGASGQVIQKGNVSRPLFILATGPKEQVRSVIDEIKKTLSLKGITDTRISIIDPKSSRETKLAKWIGGVPAKAASPEANIRLEDVTYSPLNNPDYQFIRLNSGATGLSVATTKTWSEGTERQNFGIANLEKLVIPEGQPQPADGMQVSSIQISGSNVRVGIDVDESAASGLYRVVIPAGSMPEEWWLSWDRAEEDKTNVGSKTQGLLLLMTTLSRQIAGAANAPPAAALCIALQN